MNCTRNSRSLLLPPILYKPTAFRLLQPQLEQSSAPLLPQAMRLPQHYNAAPWPGETLGSIQGCLSRDIIIKQISPPPALSQATLLPWLSSAATWRWHFSRNIQPTAASLLPPRFYTTSSQNFNSIRQYTTSSQNFNSIRQCTTSSQNLNSIGQYRMASTTSVFHSGRSYFGRFWKVTLAAAFLNIAWSFVYHTYIVQVPYTSRTRFFHLETVPYTNRTHFVVRSPIDDHEYGDSCFAYNKNKHSSEFLSPLHPDSVRVNRITKKLVPAVQRGLAIKSHDLALVHGSPCKDASLDVVQSKKQDKSCRSQPQTTHLDGLNWEAIVVKNDGHVGAMSLSNGKILVFTGLLKNLETDAEIATIIAHEIAHVVARHWSESIIYEKWFPYPLKVYFLRRNELEADHIGMLLLAAAGFDPHIAPVAVEKLVGNDIFHPSGKKRAQLLSRPRCMDEAMELYREVMPAKAP